MGRNKIAYALADLTLVVASDLDTGGTWSGATEALRRGFGDVAVWRGNGEGPGNAALESRGAWPVHTLDQLSARLGAETSSPRQPRVTQLGLGLR